MGKVIIGGVAYLLVAAAAVYAFPGLTGPVVVVTFIVAALTLGRQMHKRSLARNEALFASMFPDLQPYYHPKRLYDYTVARLGGKIPRNSRVKDPPGFAGCAADVRVEKDGREVVRILDAAERLLTQFVFEKHAEGAAIRLGKGKFTVTTGNPQQPRVRYWHPEREFKWTPLAWKFKTAVADRPFESNDRGSSFSSDSSSSSSSSSSGAATAAAFAAAGGAFDGGGASQSWSEAGASGESGGSEASAAATSY